MEVVIAGAGIGGLSCALFLEARGIGVRVYEAAGALRELGVGINIAPHAVGELAKLGLADGLAREGNPCVEWTLYNQFGQPIWSEPRGLRAGNDWPHFAVHRGRLQRLLLRALRERAGPDVVITGRRLVGYRERDTGVVASFAARDGRVEEIDGDALVGADGIHSALRRSLYPREGDPVYAGQNLWRGVTTQEPFLDGQTMVIAGHGSQKLIAYPISPADAGGVCVINWVADVAAATMLQREDWNRRGRLEEFLPRYESWQFPWLDVPALISRADAVYEFPMVDRDPLSRWSFGRVTLLGDAAHPMYPIGGNGASQAIRDASVLADQLASGRPVADALARYDADRRPLTTQVVLNNRAGGPERVMQLAHERAPNGFAAIEDVIAHAELARIAAAYWAATGARPQNH